MTAKRPLQDQQAYLARRIAEQRRWIEEHGDSLAGYIQRYGSIKQRGDGIHNVYGDGGEAIYAADWAELDRLQAEYRAIREQQGAPTLTRDQWENESRHPGIDR